MSKLLFNPLSGNFDIVYNKAEEIEFVPDIPEQFSTVPADTSAAINTLAGDIAANHELVKEPTGLPNRTDSVMAFDAGTREFTISPVGASFDVYIKGHSFTKTGSSTAVLSNDPGNHYIYFDIDGILQSTIAFDPSLFENNAFVSIIYWNTNTSEHSYFADERHGLVMDGATHAYLHTVFGARYLNGLALQNFVVDGSGDFSSDAQFQGDVGKIRDEDILIDLPLTSNIPVLFREGLQWRKKAADTYPIIYNGTAGYTQARLPYNQFTGGAWQLTQVTEGDFVLSHIFATNDIENPYVAILGVNSYTTIPSARAGAESEISSLSGLPFAEFVAVGTVIFQTSTAYTNIPKARVRSAAAGENYVDFRGEQLYTPSGVATSHSLLSSLSSDDHPQYYNEARGDARYVRDAANLGAGEIVFAQKNVTTNDLEFKSLVAGTNVSLSSDADTITIEALSGAEIVALNTFSTPIYTNSQSIDVLTITDKLGYVSLSSSESSIFSESPLFLDGANDWRAIAYGNNRFVAIGSATGVSRVIASQDGITWTAQQIPEANQWQGITYANGLFVAVSSTGTNRIMTSSDGETWVSRSAPEANQWQGITYASGLFVAVASSGTNRVMTSPDGITWTARAASAANSWRSVTFGNSLFVAVAGTLNGQVMTSPDGITWTTVTTAFTSSSWNAVTFGNTLFVAVGSSATNKVITSPDGINWTTRTSADETNLWIRAFCCCSFRQ